MKKQEIKTTEDYANEVSAPNKLLQPFAYQTWKIIGKSLKAADGKYMGSRPKPFKEFVYMFSKNTGGLIGFFIFVLLIAGAIIIPFTTMSPTDINPSEKYHHFFQYGHIFGTDDKGRDLWAMLWHGLRFSLGIAAMVTLMDVVFGATMGILMGYFEKFDVVMQFIIKVLSNVPVIIIMILATIVLSPSFWVLVGSMVITGWIGMANQIRAQVKRGKNYQWVTASRVLGTPTWKILRAFIPLIIPMLLTQLVFTIPGAIIGEASLAFIGLSLPNTPTLGNLISDGANIVTLYPRFVLIPSALLVLLTTSVQLIGNASQDAIRRQR